MVVVPGAIALCPLNYLFSFPVGHLDLTRPEVLIFMYKK